MELLKINPHCPSATLCLPAHIISGEHNLPGISMYEKEITPGIEMYENDEIYEIDIANPTLGEGLTLDITGKVLIVSDENSEGEVNVNNKRALQKEHPFIRSFVLPKDVIAENITATRTGSILQVVIPKIKSWKARLTNGSNHRKKAFDEKKHNFSDN